MHNKKLAIDYLTRAKSRLKALDLFLEEKNYADVVRESQEVVELTLKGLLKWYKIDFPRVHDVGLILGENQIIFDEVIRGSLERLAEISKDLRRDRELAFYGTEDLLPLEFYSEKDAKKAITEAREVVATVLKVVIP
jgi:HEPN domain-containing protein